MLSASIYAFTALFYLWFDLILHFILILFVCLISNTAQAIYPYSVYSYATGIIK
jgi:hypothetical protein